MNYIIEISKENEKKLINNLKTKSDADSIRLLKYYDMPDLSRLKGNPLNLIIQKLKDLPRYKNHIEIIIPEVVGVKETFDLFNFPPNHPARSKSDTYYVDEENILRTHTSVMWYYLLKEQYVLDKLEQDGELTAICHGKVYRKDEIDRKHSNVFHQIDGIYICKKEKKLLGKNDLEEVLVELAKSLFGESVVYRVLDDTFPYTDPSLQIEINIMGDWIEMLGSGVLKGSVLKNLGLDPEKYNAWAFGPGIDRLAMIKMEIPDIRLLWSTDPRVIKQWGNLDTIYQEVSKYPATYRDISFIISKDISLNKYYEVIQDIAGNLVEEVQLLDKYENDDKFGSDKISYTFRIVYRSHERTLINDEVNELQEKIRTLTVERLNVILR